MRFLFLIPARGGSKGIPRKNIKKLGGKPLLYYTLESAVQVADEKDICVSTDDDEIIEKVKEFGINVPFKRPEKIAGDTASQFDVIKHAVNYYEEKGENYDAVVLLQPTSPFRLATHIEETLSLFKPGIDMIASVKKTKANPYYVLFEEDANGFLQKVKGGNYKRRQDCPDIWELNGAIYIISISSLEKYNSLSDFTKIGKYEMDNLCSVDIDTELDWKFAEFLINDNV